MRHKSLDLIPALTAWVFILAADPGIAAERDPRPPETITLEPAASMTNNGDGTSTYSIKAKQYHWIASCDQLSFEEAGGSFVPCTSQMVTAQVCMQDWLDKGYTVPEPSQCLAYMEARLKKEVFQPHKNQGLQNMFRRNAGEPPDLTRDMESE